jgi:trimeric autotransporter adhesin
MYSKIRTVAVILSICLFVCAAFAAPVKNYDDIIPCESVSIPIYVNSEDTQVSDSNSDYIEESSEHEEVTDEQSTTEVISASDALDDSAEDISVMQENSAPEKSYSTAYDVEKSALFDVSYNGLLYSGDQTDSYIFTSKSRGAISFTFTHSKHEINNGYYIRTYVRYSPDGDGKEYAWRLVNEAKSTYTATEEKSVPIGVMAGTYKIEITSVSESPVVASYSLEATFDYDSDYEIEYNDTITRYTEIFDGQAIRGSASYFFDKKDVDWFMIRTYSDEQISLDFEHTAKENETVAWKITVYDSNSNIVYSGNSYMSTSMLSSGVIGVQKGCYYIKVESRIYCDSAYTLTVTKSFDENTECEYNDTIETANEITPGGTVNGNLTGRAPAGDTDYYHFTLTENGYFAVSLTHEPDADEVKNVKNGDPSKDGWRITVTDTDGNIIYGDMSSWDDSGVSSPTIGLSAGEYYICVDNANIYFNNMQYVITTAFTADETWEKEPNNTIDSATKLTLGKNTNGGIAPTVDGYDVDYYSFTLTEKSDIAIEINHEYINSENDIFNATCLDSSGNTPALYDTNGEKISSLSSIGKDVSSSAYCYSLPAGTYYIKITAAANYDSVNYAISVKTF